MVIPKESEFLEGDIVFRRGVGLSSEAVLYVDSGQYSHVGIVANYQGKKMIIHAVPGEKEFEGDIDRIKMDSIQKFYSHDKAVAGAICRPYDLGIGKKAANRAMELYGKHIPFDHDYDSSDTTKLYCTELLMYIYQKEGKELVDGDGHVFNVPFINHKVYTPSDIFKSKQVKIIRTF